MSQYQLIQGILAVSESKKWDAARTEWELFHIYEQQELETCLCGHYPLRETCVLKNKLNANEVIVGNCCVQKFMHIPSEKLFAAIRRVNKDSSKPFNAEIVQLSFDKGYDR